MTFLRLEEVLKSQVVGLVAQIVSYMAITTECAKRDENSKGNQIKVNFFSRFCNFNGCVDKN